MKKFTFGTFVYEYQLIKQERKTLSLIVTPELKIILKCPFQTDNERIEKFLQKKWFWLEKQLSFFKKYQRKIYEKEYVSGEGYLYLGRQYKLIVRKGKEDFIALSRGKLFIKTTKDVFNGNYNKKIINEWLINTRELVFQDRFYKMLLKFDYENIPIFMIREMKKRWGSFSGKNKIFLNPKLIHMSEDCIDYVITHELCHLQYKNHDLNFWKLLESKYPRWGGVKEKLEAMGSTLN